MTLFASEFEINKQNFSHGVNDLVALYTTRQPHFLEIFKYLKDLSHRHVIFQLVHC